MNIDMFCSLVAQFRNKIFEKLTHKTMIPSFSLHANTMQAPVKFISVAHPRAFPGV